jgi:2-methylisocitrate lyase-like PEP mutase family enzyme
MNTDNQTRLAEAFRKMHQAPPLLLLPNAWDAMSARVFEAAGFGAVASTSGGVAWALGYPDGEKAPWDEVVAATARMVRAVRVPLTADVEGGYAERPADVARHVTEIIRTGAVGINLEDSTAPADLPVRTFEDSVARIRAAREAANAAGVPIVINARVDLYHKHIGDEATCFAETVRRGRAYLAAGADCIYPFGLADMKAIGELVAALNAPVNIVARAGSPSVAEFERLGVARVSIASGASTVIMETTQRIAAELRSTGRFDGLKSSLKRPDIQQLFAARPQ